MYIITNECGSLVTSSVFHVLLCDVLYRYRITVQQRKFNRHSRRPQRGTSMPCLSYASCHTGSALEDFGSHGRIVVASTNIISLHYSLPAVF